MQRIHLSAGAKEYTDDGIVEGPDGVDVSGLTIEIALLPSSLRTPPASPPWRTPEVSTPAGVTKIVKMLIGTGGFIPAPGYYRMWAKPTGAGGTEIPIFPIRGLYVQIL